MGKKSLWEGEQDDAASIGNRKKKGLEMTLEGG